MIDRAAVKEAWIDLDKESKNVMEEGLGNNPASLDGVEVGEVLVACAEILAEHPAFAKYVYETDAFGLAVLFSTGFTLGVATARKDFGKTEAADPVLQ